VAGACCILLRRPQRPKKVTALGQNQQFGARSAMNTEYALSVHGRRDCPISVLGFLASETCAVTLFNRLLFPVRFCREGTEVGKGERGQRTQGHFLFAARSGEEESSRDNSCRLRAPARARLRALPVAPALKPAAPSGRLPHWMAFWIVKKRRCLRVISSSNGKTILAVGSELCQKRGLPGAMCLSRAHGPGGKRNCHLSVRAILQAIFRSMAVFRRLAKAPCAGATDRRH
jgi:hypothetical protein